MKEILKKGSVNKKKVTEAKAYLAKHGYMLSDKGANKGIFGPKMKEAVEDFQASKGLKSDGEIGNLTWAELKATPGDGSIPSQPVAYGPTPYLDLMIRFEGTTEVKGKGANPLIKEMFKYTSIKGTQMALSDETAWCAAAVCWALGRNGYQHPNTASAKKCEEIGTACEAQPGAVATVKRSGGSGRHVFIIRSVDKKKGTVQGIGGNQSNALNTKTYKIKSLMAVRWPNKVA